MKRPSTSERIWQTGKEYLTIRISQNLYSVKCSHGTWWQELELLVLKRLFVQMVISLFFPPQHFQDNDETRRDRKKGRHRSRSRSRSGSRSRSRDRDHKHSKSWLRHGKEEHNKSHSHRDRSHRHSPKKVKDKEKSRYRWRDVRRTVTVSLELKLNLWLNMSSRVVAAEAEFIKSHDEPSLQCPTFLYSIHLFAASLLFAVSLMSSSFCEI